MGNILGLDVAETCELLRISAARALAAVAALPSQDGSAVGAGAALGVVLVLAVTAYQVGVRHRKARAQRLRERLVGRLHPGAP